MQIEWNKVVENQKKKGEIKIDVYSIIKSVNKWSIIYCLLLCFLAELMIILYFFIVQFFVDWIFRNQSLWVGILSMLLFILFWGLSIFIRTIFKFEANILSMKINRGISSLLFQKITRMSQVSLAKASAGKLVTMVSAELQTMESSMWYILSMYTFASTVFNVV